MSRTVLFFGLVALAGCAAADPYLRPAMWQPDGATEGNMAVMVANPADLIRGQDDHGAVHYHAADAVQAVWDDRAKPLPGHTDNGAINVNLNDAAPSGGTASP